MNIISEAVRKLTKSRSGRIEKSWFYDANDSLLAAPVVADINDDGKSEIIFGTKSGCLLVLNHDAKILWQFKINESVNAIDEMFLDQDKNSISSTPAVVKINNKHHILFGSEMGVLYCLSSDGALVWKYETKAGIRGSVLFHDVNNDGKSEVVFGSTDGFFYILSEKGKLIERFEQASGIESTPVFFKGQIIFGTNDGSIISLSASGHENWRFKTGAKITAAAAFGKLSDLQEEFVIIGSTDNNLYCLDVNGELVWIYKTQGAIYSKATIADINNDKKHEIIIGSCDNSIHAISYDGEKIWSYETDFWVVGSPLTVDIDGDGRLEVIAGSYDHNIYILDSEGTYILDYVPGLSGIVQQAGHYSEVMTQEPGERVGKKIWQYKTEGVVIGCAASYNGRGLVVTTKKGVVDGLFHKN